MKYSTALGASVALVGLLGGLTLPALAENQPVPSSSQPYVPKLGDIMGATQLRHFKLWSAGKEKNWTLANYELGQIRSSFDDAMRLYPNVPVADMSIMAKPASLIDTAIEKKDSATFKAAFSEFTAACNSCHTSIGVGFIRIKVPTASPFSNQSFAPK